MTIIADGCRRSKHRRDRSAGLDHRAGRCWPSLRSMHPTRRPRSDVPAPRRQARRQRECEGHIGSAATRAGAGIPPHRRRKDDGSGVTGAQLRAIARISPEAQLGRRRRGQRTDAGDHAAAVTARSSAKRPPAEPARSRSRVGSRLVRGPGPARLRWSSTASVMSMRGLTYSGGLA